MRVKLNNRGSVIFLLEGGRMLFLLFLPKGERQGNQMEERRQNDSLVLERLVRMEEQLKNVADIKNSIDQLNHRLGSLDQVYLTRAESQALNTARTEQISNLEKRITKLESWHTWIGRTVGGIIILALLGLVIIQGGR